MGSNRSRETNHGHFTPVLCHNSVRIENVDVSLDGCVFTRAMRPL
jgi:hypothetical protein